MVRTQVQLTDEQARLLRGVARRRGVSLASLIRQAVEGLLEDISEERAARYALAASLVGAFEDRDGSDDVATRHDEYLETSFS